MGYDFSEISDVQAKQIADITQKQAALRAKIAEARTGVLSPAEKTYGDAMEAARKANEPALLVARGTFGDVENECNAQIQQLEIELRAIRTASKEK